MIVVNTLLCLHIDYITNDDTTCQFPGTVTELDSVLSTVTETRFRSLESVKIACKNDQYCTMFYPEEGSDDAYYICPTGSLCVTLHHSVALRHTALQDHCVNSNKTKGYRLYSKGKNVIIKHLNAMRY